MNEIRKGRIMKTVQSEVPEALYNKAVALVNEGWFRDEKDVFSELMQKFIRDNIEWGLRGND
jgi:hypothetical protein